MICSVNKFNVNKLAEFCDKDSVFACEIFSSLKTYGKDCSWVYGGFDEKGENAFCGIKTVITGYIVYSDNLDDEQLDSIKEFFMFMPHKHIISEKETLARLQKKFGGRIQEKLIMKRCFDGTNNTESETFLDNKIIHPQRYDDMFDILTTVFQEDCPKDLRDDWIYTTSLKERRASSKALAIYHHDKCVSCGFLDSVNSYCGIIASLATYENYRKKGYGTEIVKSLLNTEQMKNKNAYVVLSNNNLERFYRELGFEISGSYCVLNY